MSIKLTGDEIKVLKFARNTMSKFLKEKGYKLPDDYIAIAAGSNGYRLNFTGRNIIPFPKYKEEIMELFPKVEFAQEPSTTILILNLEKYVKDYIVSKKEIPIVEEEQVVSFQKPEPQVKKIEVKVKEKPVIFTKPEPAVQSVKTTTVPMSSKALVEIENKRITLLENVRNALQSIIPISELRKQYMLKKYDGGNNDTAEIHITDLRKTHQALIILEAKGYSVAVIGSKVIASTEKSVIDSLPSHQQVTIGLHECSDFLGKVQEWIDKNNIIADIMSHPYPLVQSVYSEELEIQCFNGVEAELTEQFFIASGFQTRKTGRMLYVRLNRALVKKPFFDLILDRTKVVEKQTTGIGLENPENCVLHTSYEYEGFHFLPFNRPKDKNHIRGIAESIDEFGIIGLVTVAETDCVDGIMKKWIVDGQHTFSAEVSRNKPIIYIIVPVSSKLELIRLIAVLNNRRKPWQMKNYLHAWKSMDIPIYESIDVWVTQKKLSFALVLETMSGLEQGPASTAFKDGNFRPDRNINHEKVLSDVYELKPLLPKLSKLPIMLSRFIRQTPGFDVVKMKEIIKKTNVKTLFFADDDMAALTGKLQELYKKVA